MSSANDDRETMDTFTCMKCGEEFPKNKRHRHIPCDEDTRQTEVGDYE